MAQLLRSEMNKEFERWGSDRVIKFAVAYTFLTKKEEKLKQSI